MADAGNRGSRPRHVWAFAGLLAATFLVVVLLGFVKQANYMLYDFFMRLRPTQPESSRIVIVGIDDLSLRAHPTLPRDRRLVAQVLEKVCAAQPAVVGIDLLWWEPSEFDTELAAALKKCPRIVLDAGIVPSKKTGEWSEPIAPLAAAASAIGHVHSDPDEDATIRQVLLEKHQNSQRYWALALQCMREMEGSREAILETQDSLVVNGVRIPAPLSEARALLINFDSPISQTSFGEVLRGNYDTGGFAGKAVLLGVTTMDDVDRKFTPLSYMAGVEIHAHALDTLLRRAFLERWRDSTTVLAQLAIVAITGIGLYLLRGLWLAVGAILMAVVVHLVPYFLLTRGHIAPMFALAASFWFPLIVGGGFQYWTTWRHFIAADAAQRRLRHQVEFVTHEMRSPLTAIQGGGDLIRRYQLDEKKREQIGELIGRESQRIMRMFERFLDVERLSAGEIELRRDPVDLRAVIEAAAGYAKPFAERKRIALELSLESPGETLGDAELLEFAVYNLMSNAIKYSPERTVVTVTAATEGSNARVEVRDQGAGISKEDAAKIFERFYRTADAETSGKPGLGLGLAFVREIVRHHGGEVTLLSRTGEGSAFTIRLPLRKI